MELRRADVASANHSLAAEVTIHRLLLHIDGLRQTTVQVLLHVADRRPSHPRVARLCVSADLCERTHLKRRPSNAVQAALQHTIARGHGAGECSCRAEQRSRAI